MCTITAALMGVSMAASAVGKMQEGKANAEAAEYNAGISKINAKRADEKAKDAIERGTIAESRKKAEGTLHRKDAEASFTAGNIDATFGSPLDMILTTAREYAIDAALIRTNAQREAEDYEQEAANYRADAKMGIRAAGNARTAGVIGAVGAIAGGAGDIITAM